MFTLLVLVLTSYVGRANTPVPITDRAFTDHFGLAGRAAEQGLLMTLFLLGNSVVTFALCPAQEAP